MDKNNEKDRRGTNSCYQYQMARLLMQALLTGACVFLIVSLFGIKMLEHYVNDSDYLFRMETHRIYTFQTWVKDNDISVMNTDQINDWMKKQHLSNMLIQKEEEIVFCEIADYKVSFGNVERIPFLFEHLQKNAHRVIFSDGMADVFIYEGFEQKFYLIVLVCGGILGMIASVLIIFRNLKRNLESIHQLNLSISDIGKGNLTLPVHTDGTDEIAYLASGIESMRESLLEIRQHEQEMKAAQQKLVLGMAHDLRTPLAVLLTDLELLKRQDTEEQRLKYAERALKKTLEIRALSDQLFEYFLAASEEQIELEPWEDAEYALGDYLSELCLFLSEENFQVHAENLFAKEVKVRIHTDYMSRIIHNLFSNIKKYADKRDRILIATSYTDTELIISCKNRIDRNAYHSGTGIGTKNIALMMQKMGGKTEQIADAYFYETRLYFPIQNLKGK